MGQVKRSISNISEAGSIKSAFGGFSNFRWLIFLFAHIANVALGTVGSCLSLAIVAMIRSEESSIETINGNGTETIIPISSSPPQVDWTETQKDRMLQASAWGALGVAFIGGRIGEIFGPRRTISLAFLVSGICTLLFPSLSLTNYWGAYTARVIMGIAHGIAAPTFFVMVTRWSCAFERTLSSSVVGTGYVTAMILVNPFVGYIVSSGFLGGWPVAFYLIGAVNCIIAIPWYFLVYDTPEEHPMLSSEELKRILEQRSLASGKQPPIPWLKMLTSPCVLAPISVNFTYGWLLNVVSSQMPSYYKNILKLSFQKNGIVNALPWILSLAIANLVSYSADRIRKTNRFSLVTIRKGFSLIALGGASLFFFLITQVGINSNAVIAFVTLAKGVGTANAAGSSVYNLDICPSFAGTLAGINTFASSLATLAMNEAAAQILGDKPTIANWHKFFYLTSMLNLTGLILYLVFGLGEVVKWDPSYEHARRVSIYSANSVAQVEDNHENNTNQPKRKSIV